MNDRGCDQELDLIVALRRGEVPETLRLHARSCVDCTEAAKLTVWMNRLASEGPAPRALVDPRILRIKAQLLGGDPIERKVLGPLHVLQRAALGVIALGWAALLSWKWDGLAAFSFTELLAGVLEGGGLSLSPSFLAMLFALGCATVVVTLHTALAE